MGVYKFWNPVTSQYEITKSKSIINADGTNEYTPDQVKAMDDKIDILNTKVSPETALNTTSQDLSGAVNEVKSDLEAHKADNTHIPKGLISMWSGSIATIPTGWNLCNGENGTPNLTDRFIVGVGGDYEIGDTGGLDSVTLTTSQLPSHNHDRGTLSTDSTGSHTHSGSTNTTGSHTHNYDKQSVDSYQSKGTSTGIAQASNTVTTGSGGSHSHTVSINSAGSHSHTISGSTASAGSGESHENRPPYFALAFIMKL